MNSTLIVFITLMCISGVLNLYLCCYVFLKRHYYKNIAVIFMFYTGVITVYCFAAAISLISTTVEELMFWTIIQYVGIAFSAPLGLLFIMQYLGIKTSAGRCIALLVIPSITLLMVATNDWHHYHYRDFAIDPELGAPYLHLEIGIWYIIHGVFIFSCMFIGFLLVISHWKETDKAYRLQLISLLFGQLVPMLTSFLYLIGITPEGIDPVPIVLWLSSVLYLWAISSSRLFTIMPIAKDAIFNSINDGVMVLDASSRLIEFNQACKESFPELDKSMFGMDFDEIWPALSEEQFPVATDIDVDSQEIHIAARQSGRVYQIRISSLEDAGSSKGRLIIFTDVTELKMLQAELERHAYYDELTRIYNRRAFFQQGEQLYAAAKQEALPFTIILMDIDYFKRVNDTYGHQVGDQLLIHIAETCQAKLEKEQFFARYGGEEFVIALKGYTTKEAKALGNQLRRELELHPFPTAEAPISVTMSAGVAEAESETDETLDQLVNKADKALYSAKQKGRNRVDAYIENNWKKRTPAG